MKSMGIGSLIMNIFTLVFGLVAVFGGVYLTQLDTSNWLRAEAQVVSSSGTNYSDTSSEHSTYEYTVDGAKYTGSSSTAYDVGQKITVYYDPTNPSDSDENPGGFKLIGPISVVFGLWVVGGYVWRFFKARIAVKQTTAA